MKRNNTLCDGPVVILLIAPTRSYDRGLMRGIAKYSSRHGAWTFLREPPHYRQIDWKKKVSDRLRSGSIDAVIMREPKKIEEIVDMGIPGICAPITRRTIDGLISITTDNESVGRMGAEHLLDRSFGHYAYCGFEGIYWSQTRGDSFCSHIRRHGHNCDMYRQPKSPNIQKLWEKELPVMADWLKSLPKPVGIMTCNDDRSQQVVEACRYANLHIPGQVAIIGVDNDEFICTLSNPQLSSISLNAEAVGYRAAQLLDKVMNGKDVSETVITGRPSHIITRKSTDIMLFDDPDIHKALTYIRNNCDKQIQVSDVANAAIISVRSLHQRFKEHVNRTVLEQIQYERVEKMAYYLMETDLSVKHIANIMSLSSTKQLDRIFKKVKGMTPTEYRNQYCI